MNLFFQILESNGCLWVCLCVVGVNLCFGLKKIMIMCCWGDRVFYIDVFLSYDI